MRRRLQTAAPGIRAKKTTRHELGRAAPVPSASRRCHDRGSICCNVLQHLLSNGLTIRYSGANPNLWRPAAAWSSQFPLTSTRALFLALKAHFNC